MKKLNLEEMVLKLYKSGEYNDNEYNLCLENLTRKESEILAKKVQKLGNKRFSDYAVEFEIVEGVLHSYVVVTDI